MVSDMWLTVTGYSRSEVVGKHITDFLTPASRVHSENVVFPSFLKQSTCEDIEYQMVRKSGEIMDVLVSANLEHDRNENNRIIIGSVRDVTHQRRAERSLVAERQRLSNFNAGTDVVTWEWNVQSGELNVSPRWAGMVGAAPEEMKSLTGASWSQYLHPDDVKAYKTTLQDHLEFRSDRFELEARIHHQDGRWLWILDRGAVITRTVDGQAEWFFGTRLDITERKDREQQLRKSEDFLDRTGKLAGIGGWQIDLSTGEIEWSAQTYQIHGLGLEFKPTLEKALAFYPPEARPIITGAVTRAMEGGDGWDLELPLVRADGRSIWVHVKGSAICENGVPVRLLGACQDITETRNTAQELAREHELLRVTLASIGDGVITTDEMGRVTWLNPVAEEMTGWKVEDAIDMPSAEVFHIVSGLTGDTVDDPVAACLRQESVALLPGNAILVALDGRLYGIEDSAAPIRDNRGKMLGAVLVFHDVTEQRRIAGELSYRASHDSLTGLVNRMEFELRLRQLLQRLRATPNEHTLLFIDLDQFKIVNDTCGHAIGDELLCQISKLLGSMVRASDTLARLGGDEFGVILESCPTAHARRLAQGICDRLDEFRFVHEGKRFRIGSSIGVVPIDERWKTTTSLMQAADSSCYAAKAAGRNRVHEWLEADLTAHTRQGETRWAARLEHALDEDRFVLFAQRMQRLNANDGKVSAEILVRMLDADDSLIPPGVFFPAAERYHLASRVDRWVLSKAILWMSSLSSLDDIECINVNLSGQSIGDLGFHGWAIEVLSQAGPDICRRLCIEITETAAVTNMSDAAVFLRQVRAIHVRVALDDFGAGASWFGYLKTMPIDTLKIDGQFICNLGTDPLNEAAVRCFAEVAQVMGVTTVAEFVDDPKVFDCLCDLGIDFAQGYLIHRPAPLEELIS